MPPLYRKDVRNQVYNSMQQNRNVCVGERESVRGSLTQEKIDKNEETIFTRK